MRKAYSTIGVLLLVEVALQFYLIAAGALSLWSANNNAQSVYKAFKVGDQFASLHAIDGTFVIPITVLILIGLAFAARLSGRDKGMTAALFGLMVLQFLLGVVGSTGGTGFAIVGGLHGLNALVITGLVIQLVVRNWAFRASPVSAERSA